MTRPHNKREPDQPTASDIAAREAERDARLDDRDAPAKLLGDPPGWRSALASRKTA